MIDVSSQDGQLRVSVADDGVGLPAQWPLPGRFGLRGLAERVEHLGGTLSVKSCEPHGVNVIALIPLGTAA